jgi:flavodoxin I
MPILVIPRKVVYSKPVDKTTSETKMSNTGKIKKAADGKAGNNIMLDYKIMYVSRTGNTQRLAVCIYQSLQQLGNGDIEEINCNTEPGKSHLLYVGFCVEKGDCPIEVQELLKKVHNRQIALFGTCGFGQSQEYYDRIVENVKQWIPKDNSCLGAFLCMGKMPMQVRKRYEVMEENPEQREKAQMLIRNFDKALLHPDDADIQNAVAFAREAWEKAESCTDM